MDNMKAVYRFLKTLDRSMDYEQLDVSALGAEALGVSQERWARLVAALADAGYISGCKATRALGGSIVLVSIDQAALTVKGMEYLAENSIMRKMADTAKGVLDIVT
ncbi:MAG: YjcQ family protein [Coriobacteriaceae bacterium]|jgi:hypothetical protein|nr:YjcQ family protein [Coriobacteriaceae bacterium]